MPGPTASHQGRTPLVPAPASPYGRPVDTDLRETHSAVLAMVVPVFIFFIAQRAFMRGVVVTGVDK